MSPFITFKDSDKDGNLIYYICQRDHPHFVAALAYSPVVGAMAQVPISGHNLWLVSNGCLRGNFLPAYNNIQEMLEATLWDMANWFYHNRIMLDPRRYKKWAIPV